MPQQIYLAEAKARFDAALNADIGFVERLVWFWSNHFCVSADKGPTRPICGAYEREAIRPHVLGKFSDMLLAVETHPAMLLYLDNARSIGPNSFAGCGAAKASTKTSRAKSLELHTLGVRTGYTQADVTNFAKVITGWTVRPPKQDPVHGGEFWFNPAHARAGAADRGRQDLSEDGFEQGRDVLETLAHHPATAKHIATKLATPFRRRRAAAGAGRQAGKALPRYRRRSHAGHQGTGHRAGEPGRRRATSSRSLANGPSPPCARRACAARRAPDRERAKSVGRAAVAAAGAEGLFRRQRGVDRRHRANGSISPTRSARLAGNNGQEPDAMVDAALGPLASRETRETVKRAASRPQALACC